MAKFLLWEIKTNWKVPAHQVNKIPKSPKLEIQDLLSPETLPLAQCHAIKRHTSSWISSGEGESSFMHSASQLFKGESLNDWLQSCQSWSSERLEQSTCMGENGDNDLTSRYQGSSSPTTLPQHREKNPSSQLASGVRKYWSMCPMPQPLQG